MKVLPFLVEIKILKKFITLQFGVWVLIPWFLGLWCMIFQGKVCWNSMTANIFFSSGVRSSVWGYVKCQDEIENSPWSVAKISIISIFSHRACWSSLEHNWGFTLLLDWPMVSMSSSDRNKWCGHTSQVTCKPFDGEKGQCQWCRILFLFQFRWFLTFDFDSRIMRISSFRATWHTCMGRLYKDAIMIMAAVVWPSAWTHIGIVFGQFSQC